MFIIGVPNHTLGQPQKLRPGNRAVSLSLLLHHASGGKGGRRAGADPRWPAPVWQRPG